MASKEEYGVSELSPKVFRAGANYHISGDGLRYNLPTYDDHMCWYYTKKNTFIYLHVYACIIYQIINKFC